MSRRANETAKILLIDDQQANIDVLAEFLKIQGYVNIKHSTDSRKTMDLIQSFAPDIILLDLLMPYMSGFEILEKMKEFVPKNTYIPVLVLTADITADSKRKALSLGASDFLTKPFDLIELQARINAHLQVKFKTEEINEYAEQQRMLVATKDKFFSIIAHDVSSPFSGIMNLCKIIISQYDKIDKSEMKKYFELINSTAQNGRELLSNLLKWAESQTEMIEVENSFFWLKGVFDECLDLLRLQINNKNITVKMFKENLSVRSDRYMLKTIIRNFLSNAVKFTPVHGTIIIDAEVDKDFVLISVTDTGIGIEPDDLNKLFKIDEKLESRRGTSNETGSGLELILCKEFADKLGAEILVKSVVNNGTTFSLKLSMH